MHRPPSLLADLVRLPNDWRWIRDEVVCRNFVDRDEQSVAIRRFGVPAIPELVRFGAAPNRKGLAAPTAYDARPSDRFRLPLAGLRAVAILEVARRTGVIVIHP